MEPDCFSQVSNDQLGMLSIGRADSIRITRDDHAETQLLDSGVYLDCSDVDVDLKPLWPCPGPFSTSQAQPFSGKYVLRPDSTSSETTAPLANSFVVPVVPSRSLASGSIQKSTISSRQSPGQCRRDGTCSKGLTASKTIPAGLMLEAAASALNERRLRWQKRNSFDTSPNKEHASYQGLHSSYDGKYGDESSRFNEVMKRSSEAPFGTGWMMQAEIAIGGDEGTISIKSESPTEDWDSFVDVGNEKLKIKDLCELLSTRFAFISGSKDPQGHSIFTFPDVKYNATFVAYKRIITYLLQVPVLEDVYHGYVLVIDRRQDKWSAVKNLLTHIADYFPATIHVIFVVKPETMLQKAIELGYKSLTEFCSLKVVICQGLLELQYHLDKKYLTPDIGGLYEHKHLEWVRQRMDIERLKSSTQVIAKSLTEFNQALRETELPNDVETTKRILELQKCEQEIIKEDFRIVIRKALSLLRSIRQTTQKPAKAVVNASSILHCQIEQHKAVISCPNKLQNVVSVERLLVQLEETENSFDRLWMEHEKKLKQCLQLRMFENNFRLLQACFAMHLVSLEENYEMGDSVEKADALLLQHQLYVEKAQEDITKTNALMAEGEQLIDLQHYAVECSIKPKCQELHRLVDAFISAAQRRQEMLVLSKRLHSEIKAVNAWCCQGVKVLKNQPVDIDIVNVEACARDLEDFLRTIDDVSLDYFQQSENEELRNYILLAATDTNALLQQVVARMNDVKVMCENRLIQLQLLHTRNERVQIKPQKTVGEIMPICDQSTSACQSQATNAFSCRNSAPPSPLLPYFPPSPAESSASCRNAVAADDLGSSSAGSQNKSRHPKVLFVLQELLTTEEIYVSEMESVLKFYVQPFAEDSPFFASVPEHFRDKVDLIFGNLGDICEFHRRVLLTQLKSAGFDASAIARCFLTHLRSGHFACYSNYCQRQFHADAIRVDACEFFQKCQLRAAHKLPLSSYLLKPIQRITKYQLLLKELARFTVGLACNADIEEALSAMLDLLTSLDYAMCQVHIFGYTTDLCALGRLHLHGKFDVCAVRRSLRIRRAGKVQQRHVFLFDKAIIFCKDKTLLSPVNRERYEFKSELRRSDKIRLTEVVKDSDLKFELWEEDRSDVYVLQAADTQSKIEWLNKLKNVFGLGVEQCSNANYSTDSGRPLSWCSTASSDSSSASRSSRDLSTLEASANKLPEDSNNNLGDLQVQQTQSPSSQQSGRACRRRHSLAVDAGRTLADSDNNVVSFSSLVKDDDRLMSSSKQYKANRDYAALREDELTLRVGDSLSFVCSVADDDGWALMARRTATSERGLVPVECLDLDDSS